MAFRYDMKDKTPQQQAIVRKRDENEEMLKSNKKHEDTLSIKFSMDGNCPYCKSNNVISLEVGHGVGNGNLQNITMKMKYECNSCKERFFINEKK